MLYSSNQFTKPLGNDDRSASNRNLPLDEKFKPITYYLRKAGYTCILGNSNVMNKGRKTDCNFKHIPLGEWNGKDKFGLFDKYDEFTTEDQPFLLLHTEATGGRELQLNRNIL